MSGSDDERINDERQFALGGASLRLSAPRLATPRLAAPRLATTRFDAPRLDAPRLDATLLTQRSWFVCLSLSAYRYRA